MKSKLIVLGSFVLAIILFSAFTKPEAKEDYSNYKAQNLKILPKDISYEALDATMKAFNIALGVKCNHCHAQSDFDESKLDFASEANPLKEVTRDMMKMTEKINKKYFKGYAKDGIVMQVGCNTCHNGNASPDMRIMH